MNPILKAFVLPVIRHGLNAGCVWLAMKGFTDQAGEAQLQGVIETVAGILFAVINLGWSMLEKYIDHIVNKKSEPEVKPK